MLLFCKLSSWGKDWYLNLKKTWISEKQITIFGKRI